MKCMLPKNLDEQNIDDLTSTALQCLSVSFLNIATQTVQSGHLRRRTDGTPTELIVDATSQSVTFLVERFDNVMITSQRRSFIITVFS